MNFEVRSGLIRLFWPTRPRHGRIGGHYFHPWCPYVRRKNKKITCYNAKIKARKTKCTRYMNLMTTYWLGPGGSQWSLPTSFLSLLAIRVSTIDDWCELLGKSYFFFLSLQKCRTETQIINASHTLTLMLTDIQRFIKIEDHKTEPVVSDHLGQPTHARQWWSVLFRSITKSGEGRTDVRTPRVNIVITTGRVRVGLGDQ